MKKIINQVIIYNIFTKTDPYPEPLNPKFFLTWFNLVYICPNNIPKEIRYLSFQCIVRKLKNDKTNNEILEAFLTTES